jgi:hypothetical protein
LLNISHELRFISLAALKQNLSFQEKKLMLSRISSYKYLLTAAVIFVFVVSAFADTIRMKDGSIIKGKIVEFKDQQFIVMIGDDSRGRQRRITVYVDEIESITFDPAVPITDPIKPAPTPTPTPVTRPTPNTPKPGFIPVSSNIKVLADNTANGWTNSGFVVRRGQRVRVTARGNISLGGGKFARPDGDSSQTDRKNRLMEDKPTGSLIAVIGDDNDEFIYIGSSVEFIAQRDGTLFLGINEGNLDDNSGAFDVSIEAEIDAPDSPQ